jgi:hypothetical protein
MNAYSTLLEQAVLELDGLPAWKSEKIAKMMVLRVQQVSLSAIE